LKSASEQTRGFFKGKRDVLLSLRSKTLLLLPETAATVLRQFMNHFRLLSVLCLLLYWPAARVIAQTEEPTAEPITGIDETEPPIPRVHLVQEGENLTVIAQYYGVTVEELQVINGLADDAILYVGQSLFIPGGEGEAIATIYQVQVGDTLGSIAADFNSSRRSLMEANRLIQPYSDLVAGQSLPVVSRTGSALPRPVMGTPYVVRPGETLLMIAARYHLSPAALAAANNLPFPAYLFPGQRLRIPGEARYRDLPAEWVQVQVRPWPIVPGSTVAIYVENLLDGLPIGQFAGQSLRFTAYQQGYIALTGLDAFAEPGPTPLELNGAGSRPWSPFRQELQVQPGNYGLQYITIPEELSPLLAPEIRQNEDAFLAPIYTRFSENQLWQGLFQVPVTSTVVTAGYGDARSYNDGPVEIFHTGVDFSGVVGTAIMAPADGVVVFNDTLELRGGTLIVDHGLGVMSAYYHLSDSYVNVGESVTTGQVMAAGGSTGLSNGPHLHWELRINNVPVNGLQWTQVSFPWPDD
jgi:murein DD-endopeptidase MepM/ murein hydrolase activator NlpD